MNKRRLAISAAAACLLVALPTLIFNAGIWQTPQLWADKLFSLSEFALTPGVIVAVLLVKFGLTFHASGISLAIELETIAFLVSSACLTAVFYGILSLRGQFARRSSSISKPFI